MNTKFYICKHCGNIVTMVKDKGVPVFCCGQKMNEIIPNTTEAATEKHIPSYSIKDNKVNVVVGSVEHPMSSEHYIEWICLKTKFTTQMFYLKPSQTPKACFAICENDELESVYAFCNIHGLWMTK